MGSMHIVCPHCTTSYAINLDTLGAASRNVRCSRCKEVWLARPEDAIEIPAAVPAMAEAGRPAGNADADAAAEGGAHARHQESQDGRNTPVVDSPSISADWPAEGEGARGSHADWPSVAREDVAGHPQPTYRRRTGVASLFRLPPVPGMPSISLPVACAAMGALAVAPVIARRHLVR